MPAMAAAAAAARVSSAVLVFNGVHGLSSSVVHQIRCIGEEGKATRGR